MKANELRIGNWVNASVYGGKSGEQSWIHSTGKVDALHKEYINLGAGIRFEYRHISGIPISEEILLKCGFEKHKYESFAKEINSNMILSVHLLKGMVYHTEFNGIIIDFQYLHQLQNLYFALTGQELNTSGL